MLHRPGSNSFLTSVDKPPCGSETARTYATRIEGACFANGPANEVFADLDEISVRLNRDVDVLPVHKVVRSRAKDFASLSVRPSESEIQAGLLLVTRCR